MSPPCPQQALGVTFFELACLERPFTGDSIPTLAYRIMNDLSQNVMAEVLSGTNKARLAATYPRELCVAIEGMLHKRPACAAAREGGSNAAPAAPRPRPPRRLPG